MQIRWRDTVTAVGLVLALGLAGCGKKAEPKADEAAPSGETTPGMAEMAPNRSATTRTWTDVSGEFSTEADLVEVKDNKAVLRKVDGKVVSVPVEKLSAADREFIDSMPKP